MFHFCSLSITFFFKGVMYSLAYYFKVYLFWILIYKNLLYKWILFLKIKKKLFSNNISNMCSLTYYFFSFYFIQSIYNLYLFLLSFDRIKKLFYLNFLKIQLRKYHVLWNLTYNEVLIKYLSLCTKMNGTQRFTYLIFQARRDKKSSRWCSFLWLQIDEEINIKNMDKN